MNIIIDPINRKQYSLFSNKGKNILKSYIKYFNGGTNFTQYPNLGTIKDIPGLLRDNVSDNLDTKSTANYVATEKRAVNDINWESRLGMSIEDAFKDYLVPKEKHGNIETIIEKTLAENPVATCARITNEKQRRACITFYKVQKAIQEINQFLAKPILGIQFSEEFENHWKQIKQFMIRFVVKFDKNYFQLSNKYFRGDKDIALAAAKKDGSILKFVSNELKNDKDVVRAAVENNPSSIMYADVTLRDDDTFLKSITNDQKKQNKIKFFNPFKR